MESGRRALRPVTIRSRLGLEVASELVAYQAWPDRALRISFSDRASSIWSSWNLFGDDSPEAIQELGRGEAQVGIINPSWILTLALRGTGPFPEPIEVRAITVIPSHDQFAFAVSERTGLRSLPEIPERRYPLRVSLRGMPYHSVHVLANEVLSLLGFSLDDIISWGGKVRYDQGRPEQSDRLGAVERGEVDAIFDEAVRGWTNPALELGMRFLPLDQVLIEQLEGMGFRRGILPKERYPKLPEDVQTLDFSGWPIYTHAKISDEAIAAFCAALEARKDRILLHGDTPLPLERMCHDTPETALGVPLHPAAERFWRERGYLS